MSQTSFKLNSKKTITLGKRQESVFVRIHDDEAVETPTTLVTEYTAKLFRTLGFKHKPTPNDYNELPEAVWQSDVLTKTEFCSVDALVDKAWAAVR